MAEKPIIFSGPMVAAIRDGRKTQTRRLIKGLRIVVNPNGEPCKAKGQRCFVRPNDKMPLAESELLTKAPYAVGDILWVRESFRVCGIRIRTTVMALVEYKSDGSCSDWLPIPKTHWDKPTSKVTRKWHSGRFIPRWASRINLEVTDVRVERVGDISPEDCEAEGIQGSSHAAPGCGLPYEIYRFGGLEYGTPIEAFESLWEEINAKRGFGWEANPFVWAYTFKDIANG